MTAKERLYRLIDLLPESETPTAEILLEGLCLRAANSGEAQLLRALLDTPAGEEPLTPAEIAGILEGKRDVAAGRTRRFSNLDDLFADLDTDLDAGADARA